jgi:predicted RNA-binding Zn ribbon-like protein
VSTARAAGIAHLDDLPPEELAFRFSSGRLCLAFCATVGERWRRSFERLRGPDDLGRWLVQAGLGDTAVPVPPEVLDEARLLREAVYRLVRAAMAGRPGDPADRELVNALARHPAVALQFGPDGDRRLWTSSEPARAGLAAVALDAVDLLTGPELVRVHECDATDCALLFVDTSRPGRRRWCTDGACGSRARSAAYRARRA